MKERMVLLILMGGLQLAAPSLAAEFVATQDTVTDQRTGLVWQRADDGQKKNWEGAIAYCEGLSLANQVDWRLPNIKELESITDDNRVSPAIDPIFIGPKATYYWSSTTDAYYSLRAWMIHFGYGDLEVQEKRDYYNNSLQYVRCVRGGQ